MISEPLTRFATGVRVYGGGDGARRVTIPFTRDERGRDGLVVQVRWNRLDAPEVPARVLILDQGLPVTSMTPAHRESRLDIAAGVLQRTLLAARGQSENAVEELEFAARTVTDERDLLGLDVAPRDNAREID